MSIRHRPMLVGLIIAAVAAGPALAQPTDLIGARLRDAERELGSRGYVFDHSEGRDPLWWRDRGRECIQLDVSNGRVRDVDRRSAGDCDLSGGDKKKKDNSAAIVAGALAVGLIAAAAASKNKDKDRYDREDRVYSPARDIDCYPRQRACYERGRGYSVYWTNREFKYRY